MEAPGPVVMNYASLRPWPKQSRWFDQMCPSYSSLGLNQKIMLIKANIYWGQWPTNNQIYICFEMLMKNRAARNCPASCPWCQLLPALSSRMFQPSWWLRPYPSQWQWGDTGSSARGPSTVSPSRLLSDNQTATTWCQSGARLWSSALAVWQCAIQGSWYIYTCMQREREIVWEVWTKGIWNKDREPQRTEVA